MYVFEKRDDGLFAVQEDGRAVAHVGTKTVSETNDPNLRVQKKVETPIPREKWAIHFTGCKFTPGELEAFLKELAAQE